MNVHFITPTELRRRSFHHTDRAAIKTSSACTAKLANTVEAADGKTTHNQTTKHPGLEQQEDRGRDAIVSDLELTDDPHPGARELDRIVVGDAPGEVRKTHHVSAHSPFPEMAATSCGMHRIRFKCCSF